jgi:hypothetical protein
MMSQIQTALLSAMRAICAIGIGKTSQANMGGTNYRFRGIDAAMNEMSPILVNAGITVTPKYSELNIIERIKGDPKDGKSTRFVTVKGSFTFAAEDGSSVTAEAYGEAMDSGDKATIKAQSVSFRTVLFQQFIVPVMAMDTELNGGAEDDAEDAMLNELRDASMGGTEELRAAYDRLTPPDALWKREAHSLKLAAQRVDAKKVAAK